MDLNISQVCFGIPDASCRMSVELETATARVFVYADVEPHPFQHVATAYVIRDDFGAWTVDPIWAESNDEYTGDIVTENDWSLIAKRVATVLDVLRLELPQPERSE